MTQIPNPLHTLIPDLLHERPAGRETILFLMDGLGEAQLRRHSAAAPGLARRTTRRETRLAVYPSCTPSSVMSLLTARPPSDHGVVGCEYITAESIDMFNPLLADTEIAKERITKTESVFKTMHAENPSSRYLLPERYADSPFTKATGNGTEIRGYLDELDLLEYLQAPAAFIYVYYAELDSAGHAHGVGSPEWLDALTAADGLLDRVAASVRGRDVDLFVTSDHGMVNVPLDSPHRYDLRDDQELARGVRAMGGDARAQILYCEPREAKDVGLRWGRRFGPDAVLTPAEAVRSGWIAHPADEFVGRYGDLLVALPPGVVVFDSRLQERPTSNIGFHGARTPDEALVPVIRLVEAGR